MINISDITDVILKAIDDIRLRGDVFNLTVNPSQSDYYTFETNDPENLEVGKFIEFDNENQAEITAVNVNVITIRVYRNNVPINGYFKRLDPYSGQDLSVDISSKYAQKCTDPIVHNKQKFPSIEIDRDILKSKENTYAIENWESIKVLFINSTNKEWNGQERHDNNYKAVLIPIFNRFKQALSESIYLKQRHTIEYSKQYFDKANYQTANKNAINHFVDMIAIDINNLILDTSIECINNL